MYNLEQFRASARGALKIRNVSWAVAIALCFLLVSNVAAVSYSGNTATPRPTIDCSAGPKNGVGPGGYGNFMTNQLFEAYGDASCWTVNNMSPSYMSCYGMASWEVVASYGSMRWDGHIVTASEAGGHWTADVFYDFQDPDHSYSNQLYVQAEVYHNGSLVQAFPIVSHFGNQGDVYCDRPFSAAFTVSAGDVVTVGIYGLMRSSVAHLRVTGVSLWNLP